MLLKYCVAVLHTSPLLGTRCTRSEVSLDVAQVLCCSFAYESSPRQQILKLYGQFFYERSTDIIYYYFYRVSNDNC